MWYFMGLNLSYMAKDERQVEQNGVSQDKATTVMCLYDMFYIVLMQTFSEIKLISNHSTHSAICAAG